MCLDFPRFPGNHGRVAPRPSLGTRIKRARERKRWSQRELAGRVGVDRKTIDNWENGRTTPRSSIGALGEVPGVALHQDGITIDEVQAAADRAEALARKLAEQRRSGNDDDDAGREAAG